MFDIATNDAAQAAAFEANLLAAWRSLGPNRDLTLVTAYVPCCPLIADEVNAAIERFVEGVRRGRF